MPVRIETFFRRLRNTYSRARLLVHILGLSRSDADRSIPGLVLIQIDALSKIQLLAALKAGRMPFLKSLLQKEEYRLHSWYSGMPCSTPVVQAELFYGVKGSIVSFSFFDRSSGEVFVMYNPQQAAAMEERLLPQGTPLLAGGSAYSDIFTGGADETHFCIATLGASNFFKNRYPFGFIILILLHGYSLLRTAVLMLIETVLAIYDCFGGLIQGQDLWKELKFVPSRVFMCAFMRELITIGAKIDVARGLPVIHCNLMGYHEQSHRRGATSLFAHWTLRGIDDALKRIWNAAHRSTARDYSVWFYSDHGQADTVPYARRFGRPIKQAVTEVLQSVLTDYDAEPVTTALGPMGHVYTPVPIPTEQRSHIAQALIEKAGIPVVLMPEPHGCVRAWLKDGSFLLPDHAERLFDTTPAFFNEMLEDFLAIFSHPDCGDIVILGGHAYSKEYLSFAVESGSHGGITPQEAEGFALLPVEVRPCRLEKGYLRPLDLRQEALYLLNRAERSETGLVCPPAKKTLRVMTYNVHGCVGMDGSLSPSRIARVISQYDPDIVALQELDVGRRRSGGHDQARLIADHLKMTCHFHATLQMEEESFGDAVLSDLPLHLYKRDSLLRHPFLSFLEPRGALWVRVEFNGRTIQIINTHLGLLRQERLLHIEELLSDKWLAHPDCTAPMILCGDFNAMPGSRAVGRLQSRLNDVRHSAEQVRRTGTWFGRYPLMRLDHIFVSPDCRIVSIDVCDSYLSRLASDHRPLLAEIEFT